MAQWRLRQFFEGDQLLTVEGVATGGGECWDNVSNTTLNPSTVAISLDGVEHLVPAGTVDNGFLLIPLFSGLTIGPTSTVQVYAVCEDLPISKTATLTAKPVNFQVTNSPIIACTPQAVLNSDLDEYIRFFFQTTTGAYFNAKKNGVNLPLTEFSYQAGETGNIVETSGNYSRPGIGTINNVLISNSAYTGSVLLSITPASLNYFTARVGYIEIIFNAGALSYINYLQSGDIASLGSYVIGDVIEIQGDNDKYIVRKNGTILLTKSKNIAYAVTGGTVVPSSSTIGSPVAWNLPVSPGNYTFTATVGDSLIFKKNVTVFSCADAVADNYTGVYNTVFAGNVSTNDVPCTGTNNYYEVVPSTTAGGVLVLNQNGTFTFTPTANFNGNATFQYRIRCGASFGDSTIIDTATVNINYFNNCNGVVANYQATGNTRCSACTEQKEERDLNAQCTGNANRWVTNPDGAACNTSPLLIPTGEVRCQSCVNQREYQDLNACSGTYTVKSWVTDPNGTSCNKTPFWVDNGGASCVNCVEKKSQTDTTVCSPTYNTTRLVDNPGGTQCNRVAVWTDTNEFACENCVEKKQQRDNNTCSVTYGLTRLVDNPSGNFCNTDDVWVNTGATRCTNGNYEIEQINNNPCSTTQQRWIDSGFSCGCNVQHKLNYLCLDSDTIVGAETYKQGVIEGNRVISVANNVITFAADAGTFNYITKVIMSSGMNHTIKDNNYTCTPII